MGGSPGGLVRIDDFFGTHGYSSSFTNAPIPFGAFPSLHAGTCTMEALFMSHFFPGGRVFYWSYALILYWSTMYLTHRMFDFSKFPPFPWKKETLISCH